MSSTMMTEIFIAILTLGTLVHYGKSHVCSASFVALEAKQEQIIFCQRRKQMNAFFPIYIYYFSTAFYTSC